MLVPSIYMLEVYDKVLSSRNETTLYMLSFMMIGLLILSGYFDMIRSKTLSSIGDHLELTLNDRVYDATYKRNLNEMNSASTQPISDLTIVRQFISSPAVFSFFDFPWFPIYLVVIFLFSPWLGLFSILCILIVVSLAILNEYSTKKLLNKSNVEQMKSNYIVNSNLKNSEILAALGMSQNTKQRWLAIHKKYLESQRLSNDKITNISGATKTTRMIMQSIALGLAALLVLNNQLLPGMMIASTILLGKALSPIEQIVAGWKQMKNAKIAYERLSELLDKYPLTNNNMDLPPPEGNLKVDSIVSGMPGSEVAILKGISFELTKGDILAVIGPSGAGKSTLARQLLGLWPLASGTVRLDGADIHQWDKTKLGQYIGYIPQDVELFPGTVAENIARFGKIDSEKIIDASKKAMVNDMILKLPKGYDTMLGVDGGGLSAGQKQRIALARAMYDNPKYIVMDEPNSNLDTEGEIALAQCLKICRESGCTVVVISHRPSVIESSNKLLVLRDGAVVAFGNTSDVLKK